MADKREMSIDKIVLNTWNFNPKTSNIASRAAYRTHPISGDADNILHSFYEICEKTTEVDPNIWKSWFNHGPIVVYYDRKSMKQNSKFDRYYKATKIELVDSLK